MNRLFTMMIVLLPKTLWAATCILSTGSLAFGGYRAQQTADSDSNASIRLQCTSALASETVIYSLALGPSSNGSQRQRSLNSGSETLAYNVFTDAARTQVWGDGTEGTQMLSGQLVLPAQMSADLVVYGRLPSRQSVTPGSYGDTLVVTVRY